MLRVLFKMVHAASQFQRMIFGRNRNLFGRVRLKIVFPQFRTQYHRSRKGKAAAPPWKTFQESNVVSNSDFFPFWQRVPFSRRTNVPATIPLRLHSESIPPLPADMALLVFCFFLAFIVFHGLARSRPGGGANPTRNTKPVALCVPETIAITFLTSAPNRQNLALNKNPGSTNTTATRPLHRR